MEQKLYRCVVELEERVFDNYKDAESWTESEVLKRDVGAGIIHCTRDGRDTGRAVVYKDELLKAIRDAG